MGSNQSILGGLRGAASSSRSFSFRLPTFLWGVHPARGDEQTIADDGDAIYILRVTRLIVPDRENSSGCALLAVSRTRSDGRRRASSSCMGSKRVENEKERSGERRDGEKAIKVKPASPPTC